MIQESNLPERTKLAPEELRRRYAAGERDFRLTDIEGDFSNADLRGVNLSGSKLRAAKLANANLEGAHLARADLTGADLTGANLSVATLPWADLTDTNLSGANLAGSKLEEAILRGVRSAKNADFSVVNLKRADLKGANLVDAQFDASDLTEANLTEAVLTGTRIGAKLTRANLRKATLKGATLNDAEGANFSAANLEDAMLSKAALAAADLRGANLSGANLRDAKLAGAQLSGANLLRATLASADLTQAHLEGASLIGTNLVNTRGLRLDSTFTRDATFGAWPNDPWSQLRRTYAGTMTSIHLMILVVFFLPYVARALWWHAASQSQETITNARASVRDTIDQAAVAPEVRAAARAALERTWATPCFAPECTEYRLGEVLLGIDEGWRTWVLASLLLIYNLLRAVFTWWVGLLVGQEDRSGVSPRWKEYGPVSHVHRFVMQPMMLVAATYFVVHMVRLLSRTVFLPTVR
jgi:uncharacterized protein YjbI with pentapeptide repeats